MMMVQKDLNGIRDLKHYITFQFWLIWILQFVYVFNLTLEFAHEKSVPNSPRVKDSKIAQIGMDRSESKKWLTVCRLFA